MSSHSALSQPQLRIRPESLLLRQVRRSSATVAEVFRDAALGVCDTEVRARRIAHAATYLRRLEAYTYDLLRYEMYTDLELLLLMAQKGALAGMPVPLQTRGARTAMTWWGRCNLREADVVPNRIHLHPEAIQSSAVFLPLSIDHYGDVDDENELLAQAVVYGDLGILYAGQQLGTVRGQVPHMLLCPAAPLPFDAGVVERVTLERTPENLFVGKFLQRKGIPVQWLRPYPETAVDTQGWRGFADV